MSEIISDPEPGDYLLYDGKLMKAIAIGSGKTVTLEYVKPEDSRKCLHCGASTGERVSMLVSSMLFQRHAEPVPTVEKT